MLWTLATRGTPAAPDPRAAHGTSADPGARAGSAHAHEGALQVVRLRKRQEVRVVRGRAAQLLEPGRAPGGDRGLGQEIDELPGPHVVRARGADQVPERLDQLQRATVELDVAARGTLDLRGVAGEGRRVDDQQAPVLAAARARAQVVERVDLLGRELLRDAVALGIAPRALERRDRLVEAQDTLGPGQRRAHAEESVVAEHVEHRAAAGEFGGAPAVLALVEVVAGLVAREHVDFVDQTRFAHEQELRQRALEHARARLERLELAHAGVRALDDAADRGREALAEQGQDLRRDALGEERPALHDQHRRVAVDHQARDAVRVAGDEALGALGMSEPQSLAQGVGACDALLPEARARLLLLARDDAHRDARGRAVAAPAELRALQVLERHQLAG